MEKYFKQFEHINAAVECAFYLSRFTIVQQFELLYDETALLKALEIMETKVKISSYHSILIFDTSHILIIFLDNLDG
jgi:hypothetical protein